MRPRFTTDEVKVHMIQAVEDSKAPNAHTVECNCGWLARHRRWGVVERKMDAHLNKHGGGIKPL